MDEKILEKIRKLLALGTSNNVNESAAAVAMANRLMEQHAITEAMLATADAPDEPVREWEDPLDTEGHATWRSRLAVVLAKANRCQVIRDAKKNIRIIGRASDTNATRYLFAYCTRETDRLASQYKGNGKTWLNNYRLGVVDAIATKLEEESAALRREMRANAVNPEAMERGIVKVDERAVAVQKYVETLYPRLRNVKRYSATDHDARDAGRRDGGRIALGGHAGLGQGAAGRLVAGR